MIPNLWEIKNANLHVHPHPGQSRILKAKNRFVFMIAGTQSGKTAFGPVWLINEIEERGEGDYLAVTSTFPLLKLKMLPSFLDYARLTCPSGEWKATDKVFQIGLKTRVIFGSATHPESLESATAKAAWVDECGQDDFKLGSWEAVQRRLSIHQGRVLGTTTPYNLGWMKQQVYDRWRNGDSNYKVIQFPSVLNPAFPQAEYDRAKATLPSWKFSMYYNGLFDRPAGLIYGDYSDNYQDRGGNLVKPFDIPAEWPRWVGIDPGADNTATIWVALDPGRNVYYLYRETCEGGKTTKQHVEKALEYAARENVQAWFLGQKSEKQYRLDWQENGIWAQEPWIADVEGGIDRVIELFRTKRLFIFDGLAGLRDELGSYSRKLDDRDQPTPEIKDKEKYHRLDGLRYLVVGIMQPPAPKEEVVTWRVPVKIGEDW
ncbi:MAG: terminase [Syntrophobacter sp.]